MLRDRLDCDHCGARAVFVLVSARNDAGCTTYDAYCQPCWEKVATP